MEDFRKLIKRIEQDPTFMETIIFKNGMQLSIQAGKGLYSIPRMDLEDLMQYEAFEIAIRDPFGKMIDSKTKLKKYLKGYNDLNTLIDHLDLNVFSYVPNEVIQSLLEYMDEKFEVLTFTGVKDMLLGNIVIMETNKGNIPFLRDDIIEMD